MMFDRERPLRGRAATAANLNKKEREYWQKKLTGTLRRSSFPYDHKAKPIAKNRKQIQLEFPSTLETKVMEIKNLTDYILHLYLTATITVLLYKYGEGNDIMVITPIYKQKQEGEFINTVLPLRIRIEPDMTFKDLLFQTRQTVTEAVEHQNYPVEFVLPDDSEEKNSINSFSDVSIFLETIHDRQYFEQVSAAVQFYFLRSGSTIQLNTDYDTNRYEQETIQRITNHFLFILEQGLTDVNTRLSHIQVLPQLEKEQILQGFNRTDTDYPSEIPIHRLFEQQVENTPDRIALINGEEYLTYRVINNQANRLAHRLISGGAKPGEMIGLMVERTLQMIQALIAILKTGSGYLPIDPETPHNRIATMLEDSRVTLLLTQSKCIQAHGFTVMQGLRKSHTQLVVTADRPQIKELNNLPVPNRSLVNYETYNQYIGLAAVKDSITLQATRGCPYKCAYCHKIWPKSHIVRTAEHIFAEVKGLYDLGIRRFSLIDDIFNLNVKNSSRFFRMIIDNGMKLQLFFPNGMRGDLLTKDYIDLMVKAGTINISLSLETASPRLQKMIGKNLDIDRLFENLNYLCETYPQVILDVQTMHGFPTETEAEARQTLDYIKRLKWLHFPYVHVLKIYPNTDMEKLAILHGIPKDAIDRSADQAYHELSETIPFEKHFTLSYQSEFLNDYFLAKERLLHVLPYQMKILTEDEIVQKYNAYLAEDIRSFDDILRLTGITYEELGVNEFLPDDHMLVPNLNEKLINFYPEHKPNSDALRVLMLDLSTFFSDHVDVFFDMIEPPLGPMYLLTYLYNQLGPKVNGKILKSRLDFDSYPQLKEKLDEFKPHVIGVRTLTYYKDFFHHSIAAIRSWGYTGPIIAGGPYATSDFTSVLQDRNIDLVVRGEGEVTFGQLIEEIIANNGILPEEDILKEIPGIAFVPRSNFWIPETSAMAKEILLLELMGDVLTEQPLSNPENSTHLATDYIYNIYTSGSTGKPKGTLVTHSNVTRVVKNTNYINITPGDRVLQLSNYAFDGSVFDIYGALLNGASLVLVNKDHVLEVERLMATIEKLGVDVFFVTTALFNTMVEIGLPQLKHVRKILFGGERVSPEHTEKAIEYLGSGRIIHMYGPTETTVYATYHPIDKIDRRLGTIPIGTPLANTTVYILDDHMEPVPIGVEGEIYVGGDGVAAGYQNHVEFTAEKFFSIKKGGSFRENRPLTPGKSVLNKNSSDHILTQSTIYRTGDLGRWLWNGQIEFLERKDKQVKLRGFRIELGEIEAQLLKQPFIREAFVMMRKEEKGTENLCAYIVTLETIEISLIKEALSKDLPPFMIPAHFVFLPNLPLNQNGKINVSALPAPQRQKDRENNQTTGIVEKQLSKIWAKILGIHESKIDRDDDFFELGGHSLKATVLLSMIHKELKVKIPVREVFKTPTIRGLAQYIDQANQETYRSIPVVEKKEYYPLSPAQKRLYIIRQMEENNIGYNMPTTLLLEGEVQEEKLKQVFNSLVKRQESFRTAFIIVNEEPVQKICETVEFEVSSFELRPGDLSNTIKAFIKPFDLSRAPLLRVGIIRKSSNQYILIVDMHHIIADGTSVGILINEIVALYGGEALPQNVLFYKDYSVWYQKQSGPDYGAINKQERYWLNEFSGELPVLNLPYDAPRPPIQDFNGNVQSFIIEPKETEALNRLAGAEESTLFMVLLAVANVLCSKLSGQETIVLGTPVACRTHQDLQTIIGMFVNTLPLKNFPQGNKTYREFLRETKNRTLAALENQDYPLESLVEKVLRERDASRNPLFDVMFALHNVEIPPMNLSGITLKPVAFRDNISKFDLNWEGVEAGGKINFTLEYSTILFNEDTINRFIRYFKRIVSIIIETPDIKLQEIDMLDWDEKKQILDMSMGQTASLETEETLHGWFETSVTNKRDSVALLYRDTTITYNQLNIDANRLASGLRNKGAGPDRVVGLLIPRSPELIISVLAILKAGAAYLPIDPRYPDQRKQFILSDSQAQLLLTHSHIAETLPQLPPQAEVMEIDNPGTFEGSGENEPNINSTTDLVYVIYTSGSTGRPKGVALDHRNLLNLFYFQFNNSSIDCTTILQFATIGFDASTHEIFSALLQGGKLVLVDEEDRTDIPSLFSIITRNDVKTVFFPISFIKTIFSEETYAMSFPSTIRHIQSAGEQVVITNRFRDYLKKSQTVFHNHYGPAETHVVTTLTLSPNGNLPEMPTIGKPLLNTDIYILDKNHFLQPVGVPGELCIGGIQVGRGYLNNPEMTLEKFGLQSITKGFCGGPGGDFFKKSSLAVGDKIYQTGDLARWQADGNIEFLGRIDFQVKIRGFRVEPGEIESRLRQLPSIKDAVVIHRKHANREVYLCAYLEMGIPGDADITEIRHDLAQTLPDYMIPAYFIPLSKIPINTNGKVDRTLLPEPDAGENTTNLVPPENENQRQLVNLWAEVLEMDSQQIGIDTNFFELGGHSLKATILTLKIQKVFGVKVLLADIFKNQTIRALAHKLEKMKREGYTPLISVEEKEYYPLSPAQQRLYFLHQVNAQTTSYNLGHLFILEGELEKNHLQDVFTKLVKRHESLRTSYPLVDNRPVQRIQKEVPFKIEYFAAQQEEQETIIESFIKPFDLTCAPLLKVGLINLAPNQHLFMFDMHHIISDGVSMQILAREFLQLYANQDLSLLHIQYKDFSLWQRHRMDSQEIKEMENYWLKTFSQPNRSLNLPLDFQRPDQQENNGDREMIRLTPPVTSAIKHLATSEEATLFMILLSIFNILLSKVCGQETITVGTVVAGRPHDDLQNIIGVFVNTVALRNYPAGNKTFKQFLHELKENILLAFENQEYQFETLVEKVSENQHSQTERESLRNPLFDVAFGFQDIYLPTLQLPGLAMKSFQHENNISKFDLTLYGTDTGDHLDFIFEYRTALFKKETIRRLAGYFMEISTAVIETPDIYIKDISLTHNFDDVELEVPDLEGDDFEF